MSASPRDLEPLGFEHVVRPVLAARLGRKALLGTMLTAVCGGAFGQSMDAPATQPVQPPAPIVAPVPYAALSSSLQPSDAALLRQALLAARRGDTTTAQGLQAQMINGTAKRLVTWAMVDSAGTELDYFTLVNAMRDLEGWPRPARLRAALEKALQTAAIPPAQVIAIFQAATRRPPRAPSLWPPPTRPRTAPPRPPPW
jgi:hypothetical protein